MNGRSRRGRDEQSPDGRARVGELELQGNRYATCVSSGETRRLGSMHGTRRLDVFRNYDHTLLVLESEGFASFTSRAILDSSESSDAAISSARSPTWSD
jgi:hypothetical protein